MSAPDQLVLAVLNVHGGIDGYGRPFDAVGALLGLDADVVVVAEDWSGEDPADSIAAAAAARGGYRLVVAAEGAARRLVPPANSEQLPDRWRAPKQQRPIRFERAGRSRPADPTFTATSTRGWTNTSLLCRLPLLEERLQPLPGLKGDPAERAAIVAEIGLGSSTMTVLGVHLGHLLHGSVVQFRALASLLGGIEGPSVLAGDLNCWGPPLRLLLPGVRDAVRGATWPAWRPHSRIDHILVNQAVTVSSSAVLADVGSDHRPIRAALRPAVG